jgi:hypothetical protein
MVSDATRAVGARIRRALACLALASAVGLPAAPATACGYHDAASIELGMLNLSYPESLHVRTAVWMAQRDGTLARPAAAQAPADEATTRLRAMLRYREALGSLEALRAGFEGVRAGRPAPSFSVVLIGPMLWTRFDTATAPIAMSAHTDGPGRDHVVLVTDAPVLAALAEGRLSPAAARRNGLVRLYGPAAATRDIAALLDRSDPAVPDTALRGHKQ